MKSACEDLFFSRARAAKKNTSLYNNTIKSGDINIRPLESAATLEEKTSVLEDLVDTKVFTPSSLYFSKDVSICIYLI